MNEEDIFQVAAGMSAAERAAYLAAACAGQSVLRQRIEQLLASHDDGGFMQRSSDRHDSAELQAELARFKPEEGEDRIGHYKLLQKLGEGGFGTVWMAEQIEPVRRRIALKIIKPGMDSEEVLVRFEQERQALALMDHPNIAKVFDAGVTSIGRPFFVMELVRGIRITDFCDQNNLSTRQRLDLFIAVCHAIQHAHQKGIIHRDIKPSNILVTLHDGVPVPKVIDFGVAKAIQSQRLTDLTFFTRFEQMIGTPLYMSPEQAEMSGLDIDTRSDIYSLGVLLYELLTGRTPFDPEKLMRQGLDEIRRAIREQEPPKPSTFVSTMAGDAQTTLAQHRQVDSVRLLGQIRGDLDWIVMKCLEKDRSRRYDTANGLAADLKRHLNNELVIARPPSATYKLQKAWRRNRLAFTALGFVLAALVIGLGATFWQWHRAEGMAVKERHERERAETGESNVVHQLYVANMNLIQAAWEQNNLGRVRQLLEKTAAAPERGFEWYYWQRQLHLELNTLRGHTEPILAVAYSPDGKQIVTASADRTVKVWDAETGKELFPLRGHTHAVRSVAFSPDGQRIVTGSWDNTAKVWDTRTRTHLLTLEGHTNAIFSVAFSPNGQRIVTGSRDRTAKVWDATSGNLIRTLKGHSNVIWCAVFCPDGQRIVTSSWDHTAKVWSAVDGANLLTFTRHDQAVFSVAFSPDGRRIVSGSRDLTAKVWDAGTGAELFTLYGHNGPIFSATFSPDGHRIATAGDDQTARVWDAGNSQELLSVKKHGSPISSVAFSPDGRRIVTGGGSITFSPAGDIIIVASGDRTARVWDVTTAREMLTLRAHTDAVSSVAFSRDGLYVVTASFDHTAKVWEADTGTELFPLAGHSAGVRSAAFSPDGQRIVTGSEDHTAKVWDVARREELSPLIGHRAPVTSVAYSPDGQRIVTSSEDGTAMVWNAATGKESVPLKRPVQWIWSAAFSPDGRRIVTANLGGDQDATVWDADTGNVSVALKGTNQPWALNAAFSSDGHRIVTANNDGTAKVWDAATGNLLITLEGHRGGVMSSSFSLDGRRIVTSSQDQTAKVWDAVTGEELLTLKGHKGWIFSAVFSPDGRHIATASADRTAKIWEAASRDQVAKWREGERTAATVEPAPGNPR